jgi:hypothetical protein
LRSGSCDKPSTGCAPGVRGGSGAALSALQWASIDSGRWDEALAAAREASDTAAAYKMETVASSADRAPSSVKVPAASTSLDRPRTVYLRVERLATAAAPVIAK